MSAAASGRLGKLGLAGFGLWCAIFAVSVGRISPLPVKNYQSRSGGGRALDPRTGLSIIFIKVTEESKRLIAEMTKNIGRPPSFAWMGVPL
jgi:hypothetical protein